MPARTRYNLKKSQAHLSFSCARKNLTEMAILGEFVDFRSASTVLDLCFD